jgi:dTDP-4-dehydrorhamnose 3,5-epimerase
MMTYEKGTINDVIVKTLAKYVDDRGWLCELFRQDELPENIWPVMGYVSLTLPGVARGPHEHVAQWDYFCFFGPGNFKVYLWDRRQESASCGKRMVIFVGADAPKAVAVPPGVVHAYRNISLESGLVFNAANQLYAGRGRQEPVDEIRWEQAEDSPYQLY